MKRKVFSLFVVLTVVISMMPAAALISHAASMTKVSVSTAPELKKYLQMSGDYDITLTKDISYSEDGNYGVWCYIAGRKALNLNGHSLVVHNDNVEKSTLFQVQSGTEMIVYDTQDSDSSTIRYNGYINDNGDLKYRNIFSVRGKLTLNGGTIEAGRSKSEYSAKYAKTIWRQTFGTGVEVSGGGVLTVNGGKIYGRGSYIGREAGIKALSGSSVYFNRGSVAAKGGANCFSGSGTIYAATGTFTCETLDAVEIDGKSTKGPGYGQVGLSKKQLASATVIEKTVPSDASCITARELVLKPGQEYVALYTRSGTATDYNAKNETDMSLPTADPVISARQVAKGTPYGYQFKNIDTSIPGNRYGISYNWSVYDLKANKLAETGLLLSKSSVDVMKDFSGFTPEKGKKYIIHCKYREDLLGTCFEGLASNSTFTVLDDLAAPVITENPPTKIEVQPGAQATISVKASGTNLSYAWETSTNSGNTWIPCTAGTGYNSADYTTAALSKDHDGVMFRCRVYNSAGSVYSLMAMITVKADQTVSVVNFTNFTVPKDGGTYTTDIKTTSDFPGRVTRYAFQMFRKDINGTDASAGDNVGLCVYVDLDSGYQWAADKTAYLNGKPQEVTIHNDGMGTEYGFVWNFTIGYTDQIKITGQSPETVQYQAGEDVKLFVSATGATGYQWQKYEMKSGGAKQKYRPWNIEGATGSTYTIFNADSSAEGTYRCELSCSDGTVYSKDIVLKMAEEKTDLINPFEDIYETDDYYNAVLWAYYADPQITNGMDETHFGPQLTVTRGQAVTFLWRSQGCPEPSSLNNPFVDVSSTEYYYKPVLWAVEKGITKGVDDTHFNPMDTLSTQHMITFLYRTRNPGMDGWDGEAAAWAGNSYGGRPFGVDIAVNNATPCPRCHVVQFLYRSSAKG